MTADSDAVTVERDTVTVDSDTVTVDSDTCSDSGSCLLTFDIGNNIIVKTYCNDVVYSLDLGPV